MQQTIEIFDIIGKRVFVKEVDLAEFASYSIPMEGLIPNIYIIKASNHCASTTIELFKP